MIPQYQPQFGKEEADAVYTYMNSGGWLTENLETIKFEQALGKAIDVPYVSCVNNGTISLTLALLAANLKYYDEVLVPDITMIATATAAQLIGVNPVFVDLDPSNLCMNLDLARKAILDNKHVKAVFYVALNGRSHSAQELKDFQKFCSNNGVAFIEDAAQAFGSKTIDGKFVGTIGDIGSFSFSPHKIVATGQGGALVTHNEFIYQNIERLKDFGRLSGGADIHDNFGINSKFTDVQAVIGMEQLKKLHDRIKFKKNLAAKYATGLDGVVKVLHFTPDSVPWFFEVLAERREELIEYLKTKDIQTRPMYPALHTQKIFNTGDNYPIASKYAPKGLWLPSSFNLTDEQIIYICEQIKEFYGKK